MPLDEDVVRLAKGKNLATVVTLMPSELSQRYNGHEYRNPVGPQGRVILKVAADKVNTPRRPGRR
jgi:hypothetical protein